MEIRSLSLVTPHNPAGPLAYALGQLQAFCASCAGIPCREGDEGEVTVLAGRQAAESRLPASGLPDWDGPCNEWYSLRVARHEGKKYIVAAGATDAGTRHALYALMRELDISSDPPSLPDDLDIRRAPSAPLRGMYAHQHWAYEYPYALRTWSVDEWKSYVDVLALLGYNLFQIWSMACIIPMPPGPEDEQFLRRYPPVISHARENHGMEVWIGECANNVCARGPAPPVTRRLYFDVERLLDPGDGEAMRELRECREHFYRICDNADGYWVIDSDPGSWPGSASSEFVDILMMNRELMDRCTARGRQARLVYWMHFGWGSREQRQNWLDTLADLKARAPEPWLLTGGKWHLEAIDEAGLSDRAVYHQYGAIEPEPSLPFTRVVPPELKDALDTGGREFAGAVGNAQTPVCQLPNIFFFARALWGEGGCEEDVERAIGELARLVYPERAQVLAGAWMALRSQYRRAAAAIAGELEALERSGSLGRPGPVAMGVFPDAGQIARDLVWQLRLHEAELAFVEGAASGGTGDALVGSFVDYCRLSLQWRRHTGFRRMAFNGYTFDPVLEQARLLWGASGGLRNDIVAEVEQALGGEFEPWEVDLALQPLRPVPGRTR